MEVYYMSDCMSYGSIRNSTYRDYEKFPYGTLENNAITQANKNLNNVLQDKSKSTKSAKGACPFCKEKKERPLGAYLRTREFFKRSDSIMEDDEEKSCENDTEHHNKEHIHHTHDNKNIIKSNQPKQENETIVTTTASKK
uniref:Protein aael aael001959 aedes aegypti n=1 Tax=Corethrella appendiculata TaxID=1370023 RepID=U5ENP4_9DIPT